MEDNKYNKDEISLKELITAVLKGWKLLSVIVVTFTLISIILSFVIISPTYETEVDFVMNIPDTIETSVGTYEYISTNPSDYLPILKDSRLLEKTIKELQLDMNVEKLSRNLEFSINDVVTDENKKGIVMKVTGADPNLITNIANTHMNNYINFLNMDFKEKAISKFLKDHHVRLDIIDNAIENNKALIDENNKILAELQPVITLQKALTSNPEVAARYAKDRGVSINELTGVMLYDELINPDYEKVSSAITDYNMGIATLSVEKESLETMIKILETEQEAMSKFMTDGNTESLEDGFLQVFDNQIQIVSPASAPISPIGPKKMLNLVMAVVLGTVTGVFVVLLKYYWENN